MYSSTRGFAAAWGLKMRDFWNRYRQNVTGVMGLGFLIFLVVLMILTPIVNSADPHAISRSMLRAPSLEHWLGTDELGRDVFISLIYGIRVSLFVGLAAGFAALVLGVIVGAWAGFYGGKIDLVLMRIGEGFQILPTFVIAAVIVAMLGPGVTRVVFVIAILSWPQIALVMRSEVLRVKQLEFVDAVRCLGYSETYVLFKEVIPNSVRAVLALGFLTVGQAILIEASLSFLGLNSPDTISWGAMLESGQRFLYNGWWLSVLPGIAIFLTVLAFNLIGDALNNTLNPRDVG